MKRLDERTVEKKEVMHIHDSSITCEECGETRHIGTNCPKLTKDANYIIIINNNNNYRPQQNQGWNQQQRPMYSGNYQGNNSHNNTNQPPLRELVLNQGKLMDNLSKKLASNDKTLESNNIRMESFSIQLSFNKMLESQLQQLAPFAATNDQGKIPRQLGELETANLVDIFNAGRY